MSIFNNSISLGSSTRNLVLKTRGTVYIKVGDKYHELNFKGTTDSEESTTNSETPDAKQEQFIYVINNKSYINYIDYPGDNKLVIGKEDKTFFVTMNGIYVEVTPSGGDSQSTTVIVPDTDGDGEEEAIVIDRLGSVIVTGCLSGQYGSEVDFGSNTINFDNINVTNKLTFPKNMVLTNCVKSKSSSDNYANYDFIKLEHELTSIKVKSGVIIRSGVDKEMTVSIGSYSSSIRFDADTTYIIFLEGETVTYSEI